jgi:hypothetical protein
VFCNYGVDETAEDGALSQHWLSTKIMQEVSSGVLNPFQTYPMQFPTDVLNRCNVYRRYSIINEESHVDARRTINSSPGFNSESCQ